MKLTPFQERQLLSIYFDGDLMYSTDDGKPWPATAWRKMIDVLAQSGYVEFGRTTRLTKDGLEYLERHCLRSTR